jgi:hypothetical protein
MRYVTGLGRLDTAVAARAWSAEVVCRWLSARSGEHTYATLLTVLHFATFYNLWLESDMLYSRACSAEVEAEQSFTERLSA